MTLAILEKLIESDFGYSQTGNWGKSRDHSSLVVDRVRSIWFWNSKDLHGDTNDYLRLVRGYTPEQVKDYLKYGSSTLVAIAEDREVSKPYGKLVDFLWENGKADRDYWYRRCLNDGTIDRFRLGFSDGWYTLPIFVDGDFRNFQCRKDLPDKRIRPWYRGHGTLMFNSDILKFVDTVFITEGPVDAILLNQYGYPAVSHTGGATGWMDRWCSFFFRQKEIVYVADNDEAGEAGAVKVAKSLGENRVKILRFRDKSDKYDTVDFFRDGNSKAEFDDRVKSTRYIFEGV